MTELFHAAFSGLNILYTVPLLLVLLYWCIVILGVIDFDAFDLDLDFDMDADLDVDADVDFDAGGAGGFSLLAFFNVGEAPLMFFISILLLVMWSISVQTNYLLDVNGPASIENYRGWIALGLAIPNLVFSLFVTKFAVLPFKWAKKEHKPSTKLLGKACLVKSTEVNERFGQVEVPTDQSSLLLNARTQEGETLAKGEAATILEHVYNDHDNYYVVARQNSD